MVPPYLRSLRLTSRPLKSSNGVLLILVHEQQRGSVRMDSENIKSDEFWVL